MIKKQSIILMFLFVSIIISCQEKSTPSPPPNIVYILADDLGYGELGAYGQQIIQTPNIDALAASGMRFTQHYSGSPVCAPSRYMLLTGSHPGHAYIRGNDEWAERGKVWDYAAAIEDSTLEGQRPIPDATFTMGEMFQQAGYKTALVGKWGLGAPGTEGDPNMQGFDLFYGYNCQRQAHNLFPRHVWKNQQKVWLDNEIVVPGTKLDSLADPNSFESYTLFQQKEYGPALMHDEALAFIDENKDNPFFLFYASPLPHLPLQAPPEYVEKYREIIGDEEPYPGGRGYFPNQYPRATYAAMINYLDDQVGELVTKLKENGLYENTLIIFTSDNGPTYDVGGVDPHIFKSAGPFKTGRGWGKGYTHEGGIRVPMIASWPGKIKAGSMSNHISAFWDVMPTMTDLISFPTQLSTDGISFLPELVGEPQNIHDYLYWEFPSYGGQQAVRKGNWKAIRRDIKKDSSLYVELYDLDKDIKEENDVSKQYPEIVREMESIMKIEHTPSELPKFIMTALGDK
jgi:arylsulfatase